jgi:phytoene/squalene synthetase
MRKNPRREPVIPRTSPLVPLTASANDGLFCREQALSTNPLLRLSLLYVEQPMAEQLLALHALFASIERASSAVSDEDVAIRKLAWWREELERGRRVESRHPVLRELHRSGAASRLPWDRAQSWLDSTATLADAPPPATIRDLEHLCQAVGEPLIEMELAVCDMPPGKGGDYSGPVIRRGLIELLRESARKPGNSAFWWCPLDVLARFGVKRSELMPGGNDPESHKVFQVIIDGILSTKRGSEDILRNISNNKQPVMNLLILDVLAQRKLENMKKTSPVRFRKMLERTGLGDLLASWNAARRISRLK